MQVGLGGGPFRLKGEAPTDGPASGRAEGIPLEETLQRVPGGRLIADCRLDDRQSGKSLELVVVICKAVRRAGKGPWIIAHPDRIEASIAPPIGDRALSASDRSSVGG